MLRKGSIAKTMNKTLLLLLVSLASALSIFAQSQKPRLGSIIADMDATNTRYLSDGTVLKQVQSSRFIRDSDGRTRVEQNGRVFINDPVLRRVLVLNPAERTAYKAGPDQSAPSRQPVAPPPENESMMRLKAELGQKTIEGITVTGKEWIRTIPVNSNLGNNRPIDQTFRVWYSEELGLAVVTTVHSPLAGILETSFRNIQTGVHLDPSLFDVPPDYKMVDRLNP